jgi:hypothetical protein
LTDRIQQVLSWCPASTIHGTYWSALEVKPIRRRCHRRALRVSYAAQMATITDAGLTIAEAAARAGVSGDTLRYYERVGLVAPIERNGSGDGTEAQRLALLEAHREDVRERLAEVSSTLELIDYKIGFYRERVDGGDDLRC